MGAHSHGLRRSRSGRRTAAGPLNMSHTAAVALLVVGSWVVLPSRVFALESRRTPRGTQRATAVLDAPAKWAPARDRASATEPPSPAAPVWVVALPALALGVALGRGARGAAPTAVEVLKLAPVVAHVVAETEASFDESDTDEEDDEPWADAAATGRGAPSPTIPAAIAAAEAMFGEATFDESADDEKSLFEDSGDEDAAPLP